MKRFVVAIPLLALGCAGLHIVTSRHQSDSSGREAKGVDQEQHDRAVEARALAGVAPDDSIDLARVGAALQASGADHVVYTQAERGYTYLPVPVGTSAGARCDRSTAPSQTRLGRYRAEVVAFDGNSDGAVVPRHGLQVQCASDGVLAPGTPGVVWSILEPGRREESGTYWTAWKTGRVLFVTVDGGRYETWTTNLTTSRPADAPAAPPLQDALLLPSEISTLAKHGQLATSLEDAIDRASEAWTACQDTTWKPFEQRWETNKVTDLTEQTRGNRRVQMAEEWTKVTKNRCMQHVADYEQALTAAIEARNTARRAVAEQARALVATGGR